MLRAKGLAARASPAIFLLLQLMVGCDVDRQSSPETVSSAASSALPAVSALPAAPAAEVSHVPRKSAKLVIVAGGDVNLGRGLGQRILREPSYDPFRAILPLFETADVRFVNLESQLSDQGGITVAVDNPLVFTGPPGGAEVLARAGIDLVSTANNHAWDYGRRALVETLDNLDRAGIRHAGTSRERNAAYQPAVLSIEGWSIALFAVTQIWNQGPFRNHRGRFHVAWADLDELAEPLAKARREHDIVLVSYHGGGEYSDHPVRWTREFVERVMQLGADAVLGHHPHVPHGIGWFNQRPIFYSLGNLVFAPNGHRWTAASFAARLTFRPGSAPEVEACPYRLVGHAPALLTGPRDSALRTVITRHLQQLSIGLNRTTFNEPDEHGCMKIAPASDRPSRQAAL